MSDDLFGGELDEEVSKGTRNRGGKTKDAGRISEDEKRKSRDAARAAKKAERERNRLAAPKPKRYSGSGSAEPGANVHSGPGDNAGSADDIPELQRATRLFEKFGLIKPGGKNAQ